MPNRLATAASPYLLQHAENPVDWYPWGPEALDRARAEDRPIFLSVGYSACHWCHVMAHESFADLAIARALNEHFIPIKVDREERPDLDQIYMQAVHLVTGRGGWPMSVFLTPDLKPFFGGTYWPPSARRGMPGFDQVLAAIIQAWQQRRQEIMDQSDALTRRLAEVVPGASSGESLRLELLWAAGANVQRSCDSVHGGFNTAPKFPHAMVLQFLLRLWRRRPDGRLLDLIRLNLDKMARGGIYDHLAGGFARYSVDDHWLVPHFEKMLYDNALLADAYLDGYLVTRQPDYARVARETLDYVLHYMTDPQGGFHSTEDADSEGEEGKFYLWTPDEIRTVLGSGLAERFCYVYDVTETGNFEGRSILNLPKTIAQCSRVKGWDLPALEVELASARAKLLKTRDQRVRPAKDDKVLTSWNGLMIQTLARAAGILDDERYLTAAARAATFLWTSLRQDDGRLLHFWRRGQARCAAYLDDYATLINALVTLYEADFAEHWIDKAVQLADMVLAHFQDDTHGGFFYTAQDHEQLIIRTKDIDDSATPSSNAMAATGLLRLGKLCGRSSYVQAAEGALRLGTTVAERWPIAAGQTLLALDFYLGPTPEIVILGGQEQPATSAALSDLRGRFVPNRVVACRTAAANAGRSEHLQPAFAGKTPHAGQLTVFVCQDFACQAPASGLDAVRQTWDQLAEVQHG